MIERHTFADRHALAHELAGAVAADLLAGIEQRQVASLAVSGGSTPKLFFSRLAQQNQIDWSKVTVTLVDERWVDDRSPRSNARLVLENLMQGPAAKAQFIPLFSGGETPGSEEITRSNRALTSLAVPFDAVVMGMGNDGHTASFFPQNEALLALGDPGPALAVFASGADEPRITLTLPYLLATSSLYLHIQGAEKNRTLETALASSMSEDDIQKMPVRALFKQQKTLVKLYWCP